MCERYFVVSTIEVRDILIPRIIFQDADRSVCQEHAERHWSEEADRDELVCVVCNHDRVVEAAQAVPTC